MSKAACPLRYGKVLIFLWLEYTILEGAFMVAFLVQLESRVAILYNRFISGKLTPAWTPIVVVIPENILEWSTKASTWTFVIATFSFVDF